MAGARCEFTIWDENGDCQSTTIGLGSEIVIGRIRTADLVLPSPSVSARHARLRLHGGALEIDDLGSSYGSFVGTARVSGWTPVTVEDECWLGDTRLTLRVIWPAEPVIVSLSSAADGTEAAFTLDGKLDTLGERELSAFPGLRGSCPLRFERVDGAITEIVDAKGRRHELVDGGTMIEGVRIHCETDEDAMASVLAPRRSPDANAQTNPASREADPERTFSGSFEPSVVTPAATETRTAGVNWVLLAMALIAASLFVAFGIWIL